MAHGTRGWTTYTPSVSGWANMSLKCDAFTAANNGSSYTTTPPVNNFWPLHASDLRGVYGKDGSNKDFCVAMSPTGALFILGATFGDEFGNSYSVIGLRAERFRNSHLK
jgi:hypothetical protein